MVVTSTKVRLHVFLIFNLSFLISYKQQKFNLFREENEGYAKLVTELNQVRNRTLLDVINFPPFAISFCRTSAR